RKMVFLARQALRQYFTVNKKIVNGSARTGRQTVAGQVIGKYGVIARHQMRNDMVIQADMIEVAVTDQHGAARLWRHPGVHGNLVVDGIEVTEGMQQVRMAFAEIKSVVLRVAQRLTGNLLRRLPVERRPGALDGVFVER